MPRERKSLDEHRLQNTKPQYVTPNAAISAGRPRYPKDISPEAKRVYKLVVRLLEARRTCTEADGQLIRILALTHTRHERAIAKLASEGDIKTYFRLDKHGEQVASEQPNLWLKVAQDSEKQMIAIYDRLGLTPMNRGRVKPTEEPKSAAPDQQDDERILSRAAAAADESEPDLSLIDETVVN